MWSRLICVEQRRNLRRQFLKRPKVKFWVTKTWLRRDADEQRKSLSRILGKRKNVRIKCIKLGKLAWEIVEKILQSGVQNSKKNQEQPIEIQIALEEQE